MNIASNSSVLEEERKEEPLLEENPNRFVLFPIKYFDVWDMYKKRLASFWTTNKVQVKEDSVEFETLSQAEQLYLQEILGFLACSARSSFTEILCSEVQIPEARAFYGFQIAMENIHLEAYSLLIQAFKGEDLVDNQSKYSEIKAKWVSEWTGKSSSFSERLFALSIWNRLFDCSIVCSLVSLRKQGIMAGLVSTLNLIVQDRAFHSDFSSTLYSHISAKLSLSTVHKMVDSAVTIEKQLAALIPSTLLSKEQVSSYIEFTADHLLSTFSFPKIYSQPNPFSWIKPPKVETTPSKVKTSQTSKIFRLDLDF